MWRLIELNASRYVSAIVADPAQGMKRFEYVFVDDLQAKSQINNCRERIDQPVLIKQRVR